MALAEAHDEHADHIVAGDSDPLDWADQRSCVVAPTAFPELLEAKKNRATAEFPGWPL
jgi:hypothetical protein